MIFDVVKLFWSSYGGQFQVEVIAVPLGILPLQLIYALVVEAATDHEHVHSRTDDRAHNGGCRIKNPTIHKLRNICIRT